MSLKFERVVTFGPVVDYTNKETWTPEVRALYKKLEGGDCSALAPLLEVDIEFITDRHALRTLILLKYDPDRPGAESRAELRKIANVIARRPGKRRSKLPPGDLLLAERNALAEFIDRHRLLEVKKDSRELKKRIHRALNPEKTKFDGVGTVNVGWISDDGSFIPSRVAGDHATMPDEQQKWLTNALIESVRPHKGYVRTARSWAREAMARYRGVRETKLIDKRIHRDPVARAMRSLDRRPNRKPTETR